MIINIENLTYKYISYEKKTGLIGAIKDFIKRDSKEITAINNVNLSVKKGEMIGLLGPNGAGKTTLMKILIGLIPANTGKIDVMGDNPYKKKPAFLKQVGVVFGQKSQLIWDLPPIDTFKMLKEIYEVTNADFEKRLKFLSTELQIDNKLYTPVRKLSLGERMKCELIASFLHRPTLLLLDEPTIGLDFTSQKVIHKFLNEMNQRENTTIITTSHYINDIEALSNRIVILLDGQINFDGKTDELIKISNNKEELQTEITFFDKGRIIEETILFKNEELSIKNNKLSISTSKKDIKEYLDFISKLEYEIVSIQTKQPPLEEILFNIFNTKEDLNE